MKKRIIALALLLITVFSLMPLASAADFTFTDVPTYHKDRTAIEYCVKNDFVKGYTDTLFSPDGTITREQFAVIWGRTYHLRMHKFGDVTRVPNEFDNAILIMQALGHVNGVSDTQFGRTAQISREQAIAITKRAYLPGVDGKEAYKDYADYALISDWARDAVAACKAEGVLDGVFVGGELKPGQPITRGEVCHLIFNIMRNEHDIKVSPNITNGTVTVVGGKTKAFPGELIELTVTPAEGYVLVPGSLKYNDTPITGTSFPMPFNDVTITAQFALALTDIAVKKAPTKVFYDTGDTLDLSGMIIEATYSDMSKRDVTGYVASPAHGSVLDVAATVNVTISYTENGVTKSVVQQIIVSSAT